MFSEFIYFFINLKIIIINKDVKSFFDSQHYF